MARGSCCGGWCKCCLMAAQSIPQLVYQVLLTILQLAAIGLGAYLIMWALNFQKSSVSPFVSQEFFIASMVLGGFLAAACIYGFIAPLSCRGQKDDHLKIFYVLLLLSLLVFAAFTVLAMLNSGDADNLSSMLDYGWQKVFSNKAKQGLISSAQVAGKCCGFLTPADRAIQPCPAGAKAGCQSFLQSSLKKQLGFVGILFAGGAGACLFLMGAAHGWIERINFDRQKAASGSTNTMSAYSGLDGSRDASVPSNKNVARTLTSRNQGRSALPGAPAPRPGYAAANQYEGGYGEDPDTDGLLGGRSVGGASRRR